MSDILPTLILIGLVYALYRYLTGPRPPADPLRGVKREMVEAVAAAFPDIPLDNVVYSLSRTRSAQTTSEIILERGSLPQPPAGFTVPDTLRPTPAPAPASGSSSASSAAAPVAKAQSLIERYNLSSRVAAAPAESDSQGKWEATREERERELRARKERMILEARRRMLEKQKTAGKAE